VRLLLVRHAEPAMVDGLAAALPRHRPGHLVSSSEPKAVDTAQAVTGALGEALARFASARAIAVETGFDP
jgi:hypothetical protein